MLESIHGFMCALLFIGLHWSVQCIRPCLGRVLFQMRMPPRGRHQSSICHCECVSPNSIPGSIYMFIVYHIIMPALVHIMMVYIMHCWPSPLTTVPGDHRVGQWWGGGGVMCHQNSYMTLIGVHFDHASHAPPAVMLMQLAHMTSYMHVLVT